MSAEGEIALEVLDAAGEPAEVAEQVRVRYQTTPFDPFMEWPVRMAVVRAGGTPTHIVVMYYHVVVDGFGINAVVRDLANLDPAAGRATAPVEGTGPLELAREQRTPAALRASAQSLRYTPDAIERCARDVETVLVEAALGLVTAPAPR